jgi:hypothetical protein
MRGRGGVVHAQVASREIADEWGSCFRGGVQVEVWYRPLTLNAFCSGRRQWIQLPPS